MAYITKCLQDHHHNHLCNIVKITEAFGVSKFRRLSDYGVSFFVQKTRGNARDSDW